MERSQIMTTSVDRDEMAEGSYARAAIEFDRLLLGHFLNRPTTKMKKHLMHAWVNKLICGESPQILGQEILHYIPELEALGSKKPDLEELLEVYQQSLSRNPAVSIMPRCRYTLASEALVLALEDIKVPKWAQTADLTSGSAYKGETLTILA